MAWDGKTSKKLGAALRRLRQQLGLRQESLVFRAGVTKNQTQLIEGGRSSRRKDAMGPANLRISTLSDFADFLALVISALIAEAGL